MKSIGFKVRVEAVKAFKHSLPKIRTAIFEERERSLNRFKRAQLYWIDKLREWMGWDISLIKKLFTRPTEECEFIQSIQVVRQNW